MADLRALRSWSIIAAGLAALWFGSGNVIAQELPPGTEIFIRNTWSDPARCNLGLARRVALDVLVRDYRSLRGRCVAVRGYWRGSGLFLHSRDGRASNALYDRHVAANRVGLYGRDEIMDSNYAEASLEVTAVGKVGGCETLGDRTVTVMGYCHNFIEGPYIALAEMYLEH